MAASSFLLRPVLPFVHGGVDALLLHQLLVRPVLHDLALTHHKDLVALDDGAEGCSIYDVQRRRAIGSYFKYHETSLA